MKIDNFAIELLEILACPVSLTGLTLVGNDLLAESGFRYAEGDFRCTWNVLPDKAWRHGQDEYEKIDRAWLAHEDAFYAAVDRETIEVYERFPLTGSVLDVGGQFGTVAHQANIPRERYVSVDPIVCLWSDVPPHSGFGRHYSSISRHYRVPAFAEDLPFRNASFDTVHMRSCIDHFLNPHRALLEAFRVLRRGGQLIVGISLEGSYRIGPSGIRNKLKGLAKRSIIGDVYAHFFDQHMFHPTRDSLLALMRGAGFSIEGEFMQPGYFNVIYVQARRM